MFPTPKNPSDDLFEYVLDAFKTQSVFNILKACGGIFSGNFLVWSTTDYDNSKGEFKTNVYGIDPYNKFVCLLENTTQDPKTGILIDENEVAQRILQSLVDRVELNRIDNTWAAPEPEPTVKTSSSELFFSLVKHVFEDEETYNILKDSGRGLIKGNFLIWAYGPEENIYYAVNPISGIIVSLSSFSEPIEKGGEVRDEDEIAAVLSSLLDCIEAKKNIPIIILSKISPNTYKLGKIFSTS